MIVWQEEGDQVVDSDDGGEPWEERRGPVGYVKEVRRPTTANKGNGYLLKPYLG